MWVVDRPAWHLGAESIDMVITDPPFSELVQYSELSDFFYVWLALVLKGPTIPKKFSVVRYAEHLEAVENKRIAKARMRRPSISAS